MQALHGYCNMADEEINRVFEFDAVNDVLKRDLFSQVFEDTQGERAARQ